MIHKHYIWESPILQKLHLSHTSPDSFYCWIIAVVGGEKKQLGTLTAVHSTVPREKIYINLVDLKEHYM